MPAPSEIDLLRRDLRRLFERDGVLDPDEARLLARLDALREGYRAVYEQLTNGTLRPFVRRRLQAAIRALQDR